MLKITLEDIMCNHPITVKDDVKVGGVAHLLLRYRINGILVIDRNDENLLKGVFTTTDLLRLIDEAVSGDRQRIQELRRVSELAVGEVASKSIISLQKDTTVVKAIATMQKKGIHTIPVYDGNILVGVVGRHDILNIAFNFLEDGV
ncbi:MAG: CBS domain-containing protein [Candidatus Omnitrophica bacterium]|nr:CBS domain-containing protein [Candidatus Omnitrophota bacterium]